MIKQPLISIALCTYNGELYIEEQITSILNQSYHNFELIVSDDCSIDNTLEIIIAFAKQDSRIKLLKNEKNIGYISNFEKAVKNCNGEFIFLSDQDDIWLPEKVFEVINSFKIDTKLVFHDSLFINSYGESLNKKTSNRFCLDQNVQPFAFLLFNGIPGHALAFRKELISSIIPFPKIIHHDCWISFVASCKGEIIYLPKVLVGYRQHCSSETDLLKLKTNKHTKISAQVRNQKLIDIIDRFLEIKENKFFKALARFRSLLEKRNYQFFSFSLFLFIVKYHQEIFSFKRKKGLKRLVYTLPFIWGLKLKN
jgi:glycosyltransferase involved in cell wall biosynthesis